MSAKLVTPGLLRIRVFRNKCYDVITSAHDFTNKILSRDSNYIVDVVRWSKFGSSNIYMGKVTTEKNFFLRGALGLSSIIWT